MSICKGSLTSLLHIDSCWVYLILRRLTFLPYVIHVCRGSLTSPLIHYILCFMWVRALSFLLYVMHVCSEANLASSSSWMYIANKYLIDDLFFTLLLMIDKKGENNFEFIYEFYMYTYNLSLCLYKRRRRILEVHTKRGRRFLGKRFLFYACFSHFVYAYIFV